MGTPRFAIIMCKHWKELDSAATGREFEYCREKDQRCTCAGVKKQCDYPEHFQELK